MPNLRPAATLAFAALLSCGWVSGTLLSQDAPTKPDNTAVNKRDRNSKTATADTQKNNRSDLQTTRKIRQMIVKDKSLSTYAHNVKIITQNGMVTLKGPVRSEQEQKALGAIASQVAGEANVKNELEIASK